MLTQGEALHRAELGAVYLLNQIDEQTGKFIYQRDEQGQPIKGKYNLLRHAGCIWAINKVLNNEAHALSALQFPFYRKKLLKACEYLLNKMLVVPSPYFNPKFLLDKGHFKLGGQALTILAFHDLGMLTKDLVYGLDLFITPRGVVLGSKYNHEKKEFTEFQSEYYPGEAALALANLGEIQRALDVCKFIKKDRVSYLPDHWLMQALEILWASDKISHVLESWILDYMYMTAHTMREHSMYYEGRSVKLGCRGEALVSCYNTLKSQSLLTYLQEIIEKMIPYQNMEKDHPCHGAFKDLGIYQIDYTQHNISALLRYSQLKLS